MGNTHQQYNNIQINKTTSILVNNTKVLTYNTTLLATGVYICKVSEINNEGIKTTGALIKRVVVQH